MELEFNLLLNFNILELPPKVTYSIKVLNRRIKKFNSGIGVRGFSAVRKELVLGSW